MGAWGTGNWQNDEALDWADQLDSMQEVEAALKAVVHEGQLSTRACCEALAAAEVVASCFDQPDEGLPDEVKSWILAHKREAGRALIDMALDAIRRIDRASDLHQLFDESGWNAEWHGAVGDLQGRLEAARR